MWDLWLAKAYQEEQRRLARRGVRTLAAELDGNQSRQRLGLRFHCACGRVLVAPGLRLLAGVESPANPIRLATQTEERGKRRLPMIAQ